MESSVRFGADKFMFEVLIISCVILALLAAYFFASYQSAVKFDKKLSELLTAKDAELKDWQNKALLKHGNSPLGWENRPKPAPDTVKVAPRVVLRQELEARANNQPINTEKVNIQTVGVSHSSLSRKDYLEKAKDIIGAKTTPDN